MRGIIHCKYDSKFIALLKIFIVVVNWRAYYTRNIAFWLATYLKYLYLLHNVTDRFAFVTKAERICKVIKFYIQCSFASGQRKLLFVFRSRNEICLIMLYFEIQRFVSGYHCDRINLLEVTKTFRKSFCSQTNKTWVKSTN